MKSAYYNEIDPYAAQWLRNLIDAGLIPHGDVDERSIMDVAPSDLAGYTQCHFFAGIGGWAYAARLAGWPDSRELWTGSCPCQPFSVAGAQRGTDDERHLWPHMFRLARARRPAVLMGEQVAAAAGHGWVDGVLADLEGIAYPGRAVVVPACAVNAPHRRDRIWFVAERRGRTLDHAERARLEGLAGHGDNAGGRAQPNRPAAEAGRRSAMADTTHDDDRIRISRSGEGCESQSGSRGIAGDVADAERIGFRGERPGAALTAPSGMQGADGERQRLRADAGTVRVPGSAWGAAAWIIGHDGKARRVKPGIRLLAHGVPARVGRLRAYGNAIVPQVAAEVIGAYMDCRL